MHEGLATAEHSFHTEYSHPEETDSSWVWRTPSGFLGLPAWAGKTVGQATDQWSRTRSDFLHGVVRSGVAEAVDDEPDFLGMQEAFENMVAFVAPKVASGNPVEVDVPIWELDSQGSVRRGVFRWDGALTTEGQQTLSVAEVTPERITGGTAPGLRQRHLSEINLPEDVLVNQVAAYLGNPVTNAIGWTTFAPVTGRTPNWNGAEVRGLTWSGHATDYGTSRAAALLEGTERKVGALQSAGDVVVAPGEELPDRKITPEDFPPYPDDFYGHRGVPYQPNVPHEWVRSTSLTTGDDVWLPREYVFYGEQMAYQRWALSTSSGCATGSSSVEAALFGVLELLERDAFLASWYGRIPAHRVDPNTVRGVDPVSTRAELLGYEIDSGLMWSPTGVPVAVAVASAPEIKAVGAACHPDPHQALSDAIGEAWTYLPERVSTARAQPQKVATLINNPERVLDIEDHPLVFVPDGHPDYRSLCGSGRPQPVDLVMAGMRDFQGFITARELLDCLVDQLAAEGVEVFTVVQTSPLERSMGLETVMVVAPQLLPIDFGWGNQRALQSERLDMLSERATGSIQEHRRLPHPFS